MTPPNKLEELAEFQDAIQSNEGLERLRAMQYLQQMNNQGLMGMPQVQQQPVVQRGNGGTTEPELSAFRGLGHTVDNIRENLSTEDLATALSVGARGGSNDDRLIARQIIGIFRQSNPEMVDEMFQAEQDEIDLEESEARREMIEGVQNKVGGGLETIQDYLGARQGRAGGGPVLHKGLGGVFTPDNTAVNRAGFFKKAFEQAGTPAKEAANYPIQNQGQESYFLGGSGVAIPDPNISQAEAINNLQNMSGGFGGNSGLGSLAANMFSNIDRGAEGLRQAVNYVEAPAEENIIEQTMESANADAMERGMPSFIFNSQEFQTGTMIPIRANTQGGIRERAVEGGLINRDNNFVGNFQPNPNFVTPEEGLNQVAMGQPNVQRFMDNITSDGSLGPVNPTMVEYTPPFIGGGMIPSPRMVPADRDGNPIVSGPFTNSKKFSGPYAIGQEPGSPFMANQGGYVQNLAGGGIIQGRELQQLREGGLVNLPVVKMGWGGFLKNIFKAPVNLVKGIAKGAKKVLKSKTFRALAPLVLAVAAPYALGALAPSMFGAGATMFGGALSTTGALGYGLTTGLGSLVGNMLGGAKFGDAAKQGLISGLTAGAFKGFGSGNWMGTGTGSNVASQAGNVKQINNPKTILQAGTAPDAVVAPTTGGNPFANQMAATPAPIGENILTNVNAVPPNVGMSPKAYTGQGLQANQMMAPTPGAVETVVPNQFSNVQYAPNVDVGVPPAPDATRESLFNSRLSNAGGSPAPGTGSTLDSIKQIGKDIYKDYSNLGGAAKLVGMDMMQPDWDAVYASEEAMENQLADMGYTVDTGFDGQRVYRDSSGTVMPSNLTARDLLDRALGRTPRTRLADRIGFEPNATALAAKGGLVSLAGGGEFSGKVEGEGHGMEDNVYMPIVERGQGSQVGTLAVSPAEYVVDAHTMSALGNGNADEGARVMDNVIASVRKKAFGTREQPKQIDGLNALMPMMQGV